MNFRYLELTLKWDKVAIAKTDIFNGKENFSKDEYLKLMTQALVYDRPDFVKLLIDNNINLENISKIDLYNHFVENKNIKEAPFIHYLIDKKQLTKLGVKFEDEETLLKHIKFLVRNKIQILYERDPKRDKDVTIDLFVWSILFNRREIAEIFLTIANVFIIIYISINR